MSTKHAIIQSSKFNPQNYHEAVRNEFSEVMHKSVPYKKLYAFVHYIDNYPFDYVFSTEDELNEFLVHVPQKITKLQASRYLRKIKRYWELMDILESDPTGDAVIDYKDSGDWERNDRMVLQMAAAMQMSDDDIDDFFINASME